MNETLYEVIGVRPNAENKEIEQKCLELGKKYHPKNNPDDLDAAIIYKDVITAYDTLRNPAKRAAYDANLKNTNTAKEITPVVHLEQDNSQIEVIEIKVDNQVSIKQKDVLGRVIALSFPLLIIGMLIVYNDHINNPQPIEPINNPQPIEPKTNSAGIAVETKQIEKANGTLDERPNDLDELCQDYVSFRSQIIKKSKEGDEEAATKMRVKFRETINWLNEYKEEDVSRVCNKY